MEMNDRSLDKSIKHLNWEGIAITQTNKIQLVIKD